MRSFHIYYNKIFDVLSSSNFVVYCQRALIIITHVLRVIKTGPSGAVPLAAAAAPGALSGSPPPFFAVIVLVAGVAGGLLLVITVIVLCKYCVRNGAHFKL